VMLFCIGWPKRRRWQAFSLLMFAAIALSLLNGCGGGGGDNPQPVNSTVTVTANSGSLQHSTIVSLTVN
jgi:hypothetical protein